MARPLIIWKTTPVHGALRLEYHTIVAKLPQRKNPGCAHQDKQQTADAQRERPAIVEQQSQAEDREDAPHCRLHDGAGQYSADLADPVGPVFEIADGEVPEERCRQGDQPAPDGGLQALVNPALDPQQRQSAHDLENRLAESDQQEGTEGDDQKREVRTRDDPDKDFSREDRGQQRGEPSQDAHGKQGTEIPPALVKGEAQHRLAALDAIRERRVERQPAGCDLGSRSVVYHKGRAGFRIHRAIGAAII